MAHAFAAGTSPEHPGVCEPRGSDNGLTACGRRVTQSLAVTGTARQLTTRKPTCARTRVGWCRQGAGGTEAHSGPGPPAPRRRPPRLCPRRDGSELAGGTGRGAGVRVRSPSGGGRRPRAGPSGWTVFPVRCGRCGPRWTEAGPGPVLGCLRRTAGEGEEKRHPLWEVAAPLFDWKGIVTQCKRFFGDELVTETVKKAPG